MPFTDGTLLTASALNDATPTNWTAFTPAFFQSVAETAIGKTVDHARYTQIGKLVFAQAVLTSTGAGSAGNPIMVGIPVAAASAITRLVIGGGIYFDFSTAAHYTLTAYIHSTSALRFMHYISGGALGASPSITIAASDVLSYSIMYEVP